MKKLEQVILRGKDNIENFYQKRILDLELKSSEDKITESFENYLSKILRFQK